MFVVYKMVYVYDLTAIVVMIINIRCMAGTQRRRVYLFYSLMRVLRRYNISTRLWDVVA